MRDRGRVEPAGLGPGSPTSSPGAHYFGAPYRLMRAWEGLRQVQADLEDAQQAAPADRDITELASEVDRITGATLRLAQSHEGRNSRDVTPDPVETWRDRIWRVEPDTILCAEDVAEAVGRSRSFVYRQTYRGATDPLPFSKLDGRLVFRAGEIREWIGERMR